MRKVISIGAQGFEKIRTEDCFYIDKTYFIKEWWEGKDDVTLITRPRRFGKTLNMDMLNCFFSNGYANRGDLFEGLSIWEEEKYRELQGTYPVIFISFADVKQQTYEEAVQNIKEIIVQVYRGYRELMQSEKFTDEDRKYFADINRDMDNVRAQRALKELGYLLEKYYGRKVILLLDEYDTPMQEAYIHGYWDEFTGFLRSMFNATFKTNPYLCRAVMTGITRVSKESMFSDLNNLNVVTTTSNEYATCFGFTEEEVFAALDDFGMSNEKEEVKNWYDGFVFGNVKDIYNPWSITSFLDKKKYQAYWTATSSNGLVSKLLQTGSKELKQQMEDLMLGKKLVVNLDEQVVFQQLDEDENAVWSLFLASGYLKAEEVEYRGKLRKPWYHLSITNLETESMFDTMFQRWFLKKGRKYNYFVKALLQGNLREMNLYMNDVALETFSSFDAGTERFYHGFVLGLLVELREDYVLKSNRESGYGRYDVMLIPKDKTKTAMIMEFKVIDKENENNLQETVCEALKQIEEKKYEADLIAEGFVPEQIRKYGFAFEGKTVLIGDNKEV